MTPHDRRLLWPARTRRFLLAVATAAALLPLDSATAVWSGSTASSHSATVAEAVELSGLVASPTHPTWYWTHSDVWKGDDSPDACADLSGDALANCRQVQRARLWALRLHPTTHKLLEARSFAVRKRAWALNPRVAQNNDWEDIALSPSRKDRRRGLLIAATGNAEKNRVLDDEGRDITCRTRRLIELPEPDLSNPAVRTWAPSRVFDLADPVGAGGLKSCNFESLVVRKNAGGRPTAYLVSRLQRKLFTRNLRLSAGRAPGTSPAKAGSSSPHRPRVSFSGAVRGAAGLEVTAGDSNGREVSLLARKTSSAPCRILTWQAAGGKVASRMTGAEPVVSRVTCNGSAEGLAYVRRASDASALTDDLVVVADTDRSRFRYWYYPGR